MNRLIAKSWLASVVGASLIGIVSLIGWSGLLYFLLGALLGIATIAIVMITGWAITTLVFEDDE